MQKKLAFALALVSSSVGAQTVPAIQPMPLVMEVDSYSSEPPVTITKQERAALNIAGKWIKQTGHPTPVGDGSVEYAFGASAPTLVCTPLQMCGVRFQPGEVINSLKLGDAHRWKRSRSTFGAGSSEAEVVMVKPMYSGITTNMIVTTDKRVYVILLKAAKHEWMPFISFSYPDDEAEQMDRQLARRQKESYSSTLPGGMNVANMDFGFRVSGDSVPWKPVRVYCDCANRQGAKTYIDFESLGSEAPVLVELDGKGGAFSDPETKVINYRPVDILPAGGKRYVVDGTPRLMALILGVGNSQRMVTIEKVGGAK